MMAVPGTHWQIECENATQRCGYLLTSGIWSDCIFMVGTETNQEAIQAHKIVLAMASPVFEALFYGGLSERNNPIVRIPDIQPEAFRALLKYIHTGNIKIGSLDMAWDVLYGAKKYMLPHLEKKSVEYICSVLGPKNACRAYELARLFDDKTIMGKCLQIISTNTKEVLNDSSFMDLEVNTVITVFALDHLNVDSELDLFHALARFAEAEQKRHGQISPEGGRSSEKLSDQVLQSVESSCQTSPAVGLDSKTPTEVLTSKPTAEKETLKEKPTIHTALQEIRFLTLTARQFAVGPASSELLTKDQSYSILMNILCDRDSAVAMPSGFSTCREWRQPRRDRIRHCYKTRSLDHIITALTCGNLSQVEEAAWAARNIMRESHLIQRALDEGILVALVPALTEGNDGVPVGSEVSSDWRCGECQAKIPKGRDPATPVRVTQTISDTTERLHSIGRVGHELGVPQQDPSPSSPNAEHTADQTANNITAEFCEYELALAVKSDTEKLLTGFHEMQDAMANDMRSLRAEMRNLLSEMHEVRLEMADFRVCLSGVSARVETLERRLDAVEQEHAVAAAAPAPHSPAIAHLQTVVGLLQQEVADRDQEALLSDLEIGHLPEERGESALQAVTVLAAKLGVELDPRDVVYAERVGVPQGAAAGSEQPRARRLVVRLARRDVRDSLLAAARVRRTLTTADAGRATTGGAHARIFINERLTRANRVLFARARELARKHQWRFIWTKRGRVNVREADGKQAFQIRTQADLDRIFGSSPV